MIGTLLAALRTLRCACIDLPRLLLPMAAPRVFDVPSPTDAAGLARVRRDFAPVLRRLGLELTVEGAPRVPADGGLVFMWNQTSHLDHLVVPLACPRPFFCLYNNEVARLPLYGAHMARTGHVHLDRHRPDQWRAAIARAAARVAAGACVIVSPEGTRSRGDALLPFKPGAFLLARAAGRPIVCLTVSGARAALPRDGLVVRPGRLHVVASAPIPTDDGDELAPLMDRVAATFRADRRGA